VKAGSVLRVRGSQSLGQERLERLANQLVLPVVEHLCEPTVGAKDLSGAVHDDDPEGRRLEDGIGQSRPTGIDRGRRGRRRRVC
jgi:hypothetical protein